MIYRMLLALVTDSMLKLNRPMPRTDCPSLSLGFHCTSPAEQIRLLGTARGMDLRVIIEVLIAVEECLGSVGIF